MKIDDYGDENDQKQTNTMPFKSKYTPFRHNYFVKKGPNQPGRGHPPTVSQSWKFQLAAHLSPIVETILFIYGNISEIVVKSI